MTESNESARQVILAVMKEVQAVSKSNVNQQQGFKFRGIDAVVNAVGPALRKHEGFIVPQVDTVNYSSAQTARGGLMNICRVSVTYSVYGPDGTAVSGTVFAEAFDAGDKATAKAMSVAYRTFLLQVLCLPTDEPDPDEFTYEVVAPRDYLSELKKAKTLESVRELWLEASKAKASKDVLTEIENKAKSFEQEKTT